MSVVVAGMGWCRLVGVGGQCGGTLRQALQRRDREALQGEQAYKSTDQHH